MRERERERERDVVYGCFLGVEEGGEGDNEKRGKTTKYIKMKQRS